MSASLVPKKAAKNALKGKGKEKHAKGKERAHDEVTEARNEGTDPKWTYAPPEGAVLPDIENIEFGDFDYDQFKGDEDAELWLVRVPNNVRRPRRSFTPPTRGPSSAAAPISDCSMLYMYI